MIFFKIFLFSVVLAEMRHVEAVSIADMIATFNSTTNVTNQNVGNCPPCICQCVPIVFPACSSPNVNPGLAAALTSNSTQAPTTILSTTLAPTTLAPTTVAPTTLPPTTLPPTTEAPTTIPSTTIPPTTIQPQSSVCTTTYQIKTASNANLKMLCYIAGKPMSTANATAFCASNGMTLYELADADSVAGYQEFVNYYVLSTGPRFIANGIQINGQWVLYTNQQVPLYSGIVWGPSTVTVNPPIFLYAREVNMTFSGYAFNNGAAAYFMCQY